VLPKRPPVAGLAPKRPPEVVLPKPVLAGCCCPNGVEVLFEPPNNPPPVVVEAVLPKPVVLGVVVEPKPPKPVPVPKAPACPLLLPNFLPWL